MEHRIDPWLMFCATSIIGASVANQAAISRAMGAGLFMRQAVFGCVGLLLMWLCSRIRTTVWQRIGPMAYGLGLAALLLVLVVGDVRSGTRGWFALGPLTLQPSEFARTATLLMVAGWLARRETDELDLRGFLGLVALMAAPVGLVLLQPDLGVAMTYLPILGGALWLGGLPNRVWVVLILLGVISVGVAWNTVLKPYQKDRVMTVLNPESDPYGAGYQVRQSRIAVGSGGLWGQGLGRGSQSLLRFLPAQHTDFAFAAWAEGTGFAGAAGLLALFGALLWRLAKAGLTAEERFGMVFSLLVFCWFGFQVIVNLGMVLGWLPTTGITLPLFSYGGSSLLSTCLTLGMVQAIWRSRLVNL
jgi:rod shape determining protein RodA